MSLGRVTVTNDDGSELARITVAAEGWTYRCLLGPCPTSYRFKAASVALDEFEAHIEDRHSTC